jgi:hypothetical protein
MVESTEIEIAAQSAPTEDPSKTTEMVSLSAADDPILSGEKPETTDLE